MFQSDLNLDVSKLEPSATSEQTGKFNEMLISILKSGPSWYEVGAEKYRVMRRNGETPLPAPILLDGDSSFSIPSREHGRSIPTRIVMPDAGRKVDAVYMHIHGGGWVLQSEDSQDPLLKSIANGAGLAVISIGYRLAPEDPFPKGPEDCYDAAEWLVDHAVEKFGVPLQFMGGESAGGHLSALTVFHLLQSRPDFQFSGVILNYGCFDLSFLPSARNYPRPLVLTPEIMEKYIEVFLPRRSLLERKDPSISPFYKDLNRLRLPSAFFTCGTEDCLLDDTVMMALKWQMAGAEAIVKLFPGAPHGFNMFPPDKLPESKKCNDLIAQYLVEKLKV